MKGCIFFTNNFCQRSGLAWGVSPWRRCGRHTVSLSYLCHSNNSFIWAAAGWGRDGSRATSLIITNMFSWWSSHRSCLLELQDTERHIYAFIYCSGMNPPDSGRDLKGTNLWDHEPDTHFPFLHNNPVTSRWWVWLLCCDELLSHQNCINLSRYLMKWLLHDYR